MADAWQTFPVQFQGGLITNISPVQLGLQSSGAATTLRNFEPSVEGGYKKVLGYTKYDNNALAGSGVVRGVFLFGSDVLASRGTHVYKSAGSGWTQLTDNSSFSSAGITLGGSGKVRFAKFNFNGTEKVLITDGNGKPFLYDGTTFSQLSSLGTDFVGCNNVIIFNTHVIFIKGTKLLYSAPLDLTFTSASGAGTIDFTDTITDIIEFREQLIIFSKSKIKRVSGGFTGNFVLESVSDDMGCVAEDTAKEVAGDVIFLGPDGLRTLGGTERIGDFNLALISRNIQREVTKFTDTFTNFASLVIRGKSQYRIFAYESTIPSASSAGLLATQTENGFSWAELRGFKVHVAHSEYKSITDNEVVYFANDDGYIYKMESGFTFDTANINASYVGPDLSITDPRIRKTLYKANLYIKSDDSVLIKYGNVTAQYGSSIYSQASSSFDFNVLFDYSEQSTNTVQPDLITLTGKSPFQNQFSFPLVGSGFTTTIQVSANNAQPSFSLDSIMFDYTNHDRR